MLKTWLCILCASKKKSKRKGMPTNKTIFINMAHFIFRKRPYPQISPWLNMGIPGVETRSSIFNTFKLINHKLSITLISQKTTPWLLNVLNFGLVRRLQVSCADHFTVRSGSQFSVFVLIFNAEKSAGYHLCTYVITV